ncbi:MAG TPA: BamA/TamA family outer membrane protein [Vicinamibacterales bacterium]|nr:BamA/TamA family outer membrane protein [Vicinamibacterales bacterium]
MKRTAAFALTLALSLAVAPAPASAQVGYFGQNKVQYRTFDFKVLKTDHFDIYYYPEEEPASRMAARMAERWYARLSTILSHELRGRQALVLYASPSQFRQTNVVAGELGEGTGGVTEAYKRRIVLPFAGPLEATDHVLGHELVHAFQYDITSTNASSAAAGNAGALNLPLWFIEGMAEYLSLGPRDPHTAMWMREAIRREKFPTIADLDDPRYFPYRYGHAFWAFIGGRYGDRAIGSMLRSGAGSDGYKGAFTRVLGLSEKEVSQQWHDATMAAYRPVAEATKLVSASARPLITEKPNRGGLNVSPELSPDGSRVAFFSARDLFSIDLYIADATTGKIIRKITDNATSPHIESIGFIDSAGAWSRDSQRFAYATLSGGRAVLFIANARTGDEERRIPVPEVDEILNPAWSPDGNRIAFAALTGGLSDLFIYDLASSTLKRMTSDAYSELHPAWSPDGRSIAFASDRFSSDLRDLDAGPPKLALLDVATGDVRALGGFEGAKNINPQWTPDSRALYFISDRQGISNIYRIDAAGGEPLQVTNLLTGVSGITAMSPALSVGGSRVVFSVYEADSYNIYALDNDATTSGSALATGLPRDAGILPPRTTGEGTVYAYLRQQTAGLPSIAAEAAYETTPYKPKLSLDFIGQPTVGVGVDSFGSYVGGGISAAFSDILGNHTVGGTLQLTNRFDEAGGSVVYLNRSRRWNWGAAVDSTPYVQRGFGQGLVDAGNGQVAVAEEELRIIQTDRGVAGIAAYPFNRAQRLEFTGGLRQISGKQDLTTRLFDINTGQQLTEDRQTLSRFPTLNLGMVSSALVYDTSIFGATSPIRGQRYRLEIDQTAGDLSYGSALADYRTYLMPVRPFTIALRGMYYGRYGRDAESSLLTPVFLGYTELVRGYDYGSFRAEECGTATDGTCPVFDKLFGSRMVLANLELRFPLWGAFGGDNFYGPLPVELGVFTDAGAAWDRSGSLRLTGSDGKLVRSVGALIRANLFGFAIAEIDYVRPIDRPGRGWLWAFNLRPGF